MSERRPVLRLCTDEVPRGPWVYARQVEPATEPVAPGDLVEVVDLSERFLGHAFFNPASDIRLRWLSRGRRRALDRPVEFLGARLRSADRLRRRVLRLPEVTDAYRVVHAEGDDLSGLIVDRLGPALVCEYHALGFWRMRREVEQVLRELYPEIEPDRIVHRVPRSAARAEGFDSPAPDAPAREVIVTEHGVRLPVLPGEGHKTGYFCDQRENRLRIASLAAGRSVLDLFCNTGGFALQAARAGARRVRAVDLDEKVLERATRAAALNELSVETLHADAFDVLREVLAADERPEVIVVDPHKVVANRGQLERGLRTYSDLNTLALRAVRPEGLVATFSCSGALDLAPFLGMVFGAARRAEREVRLLQVLGAAADHPQRGSWSRSRYLKGALLAVD